MSSEQSHQAGEDNIDPDAPFPPDWLQYLAKHELAGKTLYISADSDISGVGIDIRIFSADEASHEIKRYRPAMDVLPLGLVPVGECVMGTGNPYFIFFKQGAQSPLLRVDHACGLSQKQIADTSNFDITLKTASQLADFLTD